MQENFNKLEDYIFTHIFNNIFSKNYALKVSIVGEKTLFGSYKCPITIQISVQDKNNRIVAVCSFQVGEYHDCGTRICKRYNLTHFRPDKNLQTKFNSLIRTTLLFLFSRKRYNKRIRQFYGDSSDIYKATLTAGNNVNYNLLTTCALKKTLNMSFLKIIPFKQAAKFTNPNYKSKNSRAIFMWHCTETPFRGTLLYKKQKHIK